MAARGSMHAEIASWRISQAAKAALEAYLTQQGCNLAHPRDKVFTGLTLQTLISAGILNPAEQATILFFSKFASCWELASEPMGGIKMTDQSKTSGQTIAVNSKAALTVLPWDSIENECMAYFATKEDALSSQNLCYSDNLDARPAARNEKQMYTRLMPTHFRLLNDLSQALDLGMNIDDAHARICNTAFLAREMLAREDGTANRVVPVEVKPPSQDKLGEMSFSQAFNSVVHKCKAVKPAAQILSAMVQEGSQFGLLYGADSLVAVKRTTQPGDKTLYFSKSFEHDGLGPTSQMITLYVLNLAQDAPFLDPMQFPPTPRGQVWEAKATKRASWFMRTLQGSRSEEQNPSSRCTAGQPRSQQTANDGSQDEDLDALEAQQELQALGWRDILELPDTKTGCKLLLRALPEASYADLHLQEQISGGPATQVWSSELEGRQTVTKVYNFGRDQNVLKDMITEIAAAAFLPEDVRPDILGIGITLQTLAFLIFEYKGRQMDQAGLALLGEQVRTKLASAHNAGIIHLDIALRNLVVLRNQVSIVDWANCSFTDDPALQRVDWEELRIMV